MRRRTFLRRMAGLAALAAGARFTSASGSDPLGTVLPKRPFGATGESVTILGLGGFHIGWTSERLARETIEAALEHGVRFFDTAESYGPHTSEERYGKYLCPRYRDKIFLMTKSAATDPAVARRHLEESLRRLQTDVIDLWQLHALGSLEDTDRRIAAGVVEVALRAREEGKIRHIGFTGHASPGALSRMLEAFPESPFAAVQCPVNAVDAADDGGFIREVLPQAARRNCAVLAMKTLADGRFFASKQMGEREVWRTDDPVVPGHLTLADALAFVWSLPVATLITGAENPGFLTEKAELAKAVPALGEEERAGLIARVAAFAGAGEVEYYKR